MSLIPFFSPCVALTVLQGGLSYTWKVLLTVIEVLEFRMFLLTLGLLTLMCVPTF
jgi:hypothetical protein